MGMASMVKHDISSNVLDMAWMEGGGILLDSGSRQLIALSSFGGILLMSGSRQLIVSTLTSLGSWSLFVVSSFPDMLLVCQGICNGMSGCR